MWVIKLSAIGHPELNVAILVANEEVKEQAKQICASKFGSLGFVELQACNVPDSVLVDMYGADVLSTAVTNFTEAIASQMMSKLMLYTWPTGMTEA